MKKFVVLLLALTMLCGVVASASADDKIKIGISIWSSTDTLGSEVKRLIDAAADALGVETQWVDQAHISEQVTASAETLALADCDGIIICNSASAEMGSVIKTADEKRNVCRPVLPCDRSGSQPGRICPGCFFQVLCRRGP